MQIDESEITWDRPSGSAPTAPPRPTPASGLSPSSSTSLAMETQSSARVAPPIDPASVKWDEPAPAASNPSLAMGAPGMPQMQPVQADPTEGMGHFQRFWAGAGKAVADTGRGIGQWLGLVKQSDVDEAAARDRALMNTAGGIAGNIGGQVAQMALGGAGAGAVAGGAAMAAKVGPITRAALQAGTFAALQPVKTGDTRLGNTAEGATLGAVGQGIASGVHRLAAGASDTIAPHVRDLYHRAVAAGIPVNVAQLSDSRFLKTLSSQLERLPLTGAAEARQGQQLAFNRAVSRTMGEDAERITPDIYSAAKARIGREFEGLSARNSLVVDMPLVGRLAGVVDDANRYAAGDTARAVGNLVDDVLAKVDASGMLPGRAYQSMDSQLGRLMKTGGEKAHYLGQVREAMRDAMDQSLTAADREAWNIARQQWRALKTVRDLAAKDPSGNIAAGQLAGRVGASNAGKEALASGTAGELGDLAAIGKAFVRDPVPDSGTSQRLLAQALLTGGVGGGAYYAGNRDPGTAAAAVAASLAGGRALSAVLNSPAAARYMVEGAGPVTRAAAVAAKALPTGLPAAVRAREQQGRDDGPSTAARRFADGGLVTLLPGISSELDARAHEAASSPLNDLPEPTERQAAAGNYKVGRVRLHGMEISIENPSGSTRRGRDPDGSEWESTLAWHYGYIRGTRGNDGDQVDVFIGPNPESRTVFVVDQLNPDGTFDEAKALIGFDSEQEAREGYLANYPPGWQGLGAITALPMAAFKAWVRSGRLREPLTVVRHEQQERAALISRLSAASEGNDLRALVRARLDVLKFNQDHPRAVIAPIHLGRTEAAAPH